MGMPFVLRRGESWVNNKDSDFYVEFTEPKKPIKVSLMLIFLESGITTFHLFFNYYYYFFLFTS